MKILLILPKPPVPSVDGGCLAIANFLELLCRDHHVHALVLHTPKHPYTEASEHFFASRTVSATPLFVDTGFKMHHIFRILRGKESYQVSRFRVREHQAHIHSLLHSQKFDAVIFESIFTCVYMPVVRAFKLPIFIRMHNIEHQIWHPLRKAITNPVHRFVALRETALLQTFEASVLHDASGLIPIANTDAQFVHQHIDAKKPLVTIPFAVQPVTNEVLPPVQPLHFFHLGAMDWKPNQEAMRWWHTHIWPELLRALPGAQFKMAGRGMPNEFKTWQHANFMVEAEIERAEEYMKRAGILVVPLQFGSGIRIKIIEAMQWGVPVIATSKALEGLAVTHQKQVCIANTTAEFVQAAQYLQNTEHYLKLQQEAISWVNAHLNADILRQSLANFMRQIVDESLGY